MGKVALITGGASGIGLATARALAKDGWEVSIVDLNVGVGEKIAAELGGMFCKANVLSQEELADSFQRTWTKYGRLDFVFANAGIVEKVDFYERHTSECPPPLDLSVLNIDLGAVTVTTYLAIHFLRKNHGGNIVITASSGGLYAPQYLPMYGAAKHGCVGLTRAVAGPLFTEGIRVNCICPGAVMTGLLDAKEWERFPREMFTPIEKVVETVKMLASNEELSGQAVELIQDRHYFRDSPQPLDPAMKEVMAKTQA